MIVFVIMIVIVFVIFNYGNNITGACNLLMVIVTVNVIITKVVVVIVIIETINFTVLLSSLLSSSMATSHSLSMSLEAIGCILSFIGIVLVINRVIHAKYNPFQVMDEVGVRRIVFSSSATVYGVPEYLPLDEKHRTGIATIVLQPI